MTDTVVAAPTNTGHGKSSASFFATYIVFHVAVYLQKHYNMPIDETTEPVMALLVWGSVWLTPAHFIATIKQAIADWKDIVRQWKQP